MKGRSVRAVHRALISTTFRAAFRVFAFCASAALLMAVPGPVAAQTHDAGRDRAPSPVIELRRLLREQLGAGRIEAAIRSAQEALIRFPDDRAVREEFVELHTSLARGMMADEDFTGAERALSAVLKEDADNAEATRLKRAIEEARLEAPERVEQAQRRLELEWFEPAFNTIRQATKLLPARRSDWAKAYRSAGIGAGDDHYFTRNFHEAFYYYDAAIQIGEEMAEPLSAALLSRWAQCMVHALAEDIHRARYPPAYWRLVLRRAEAAELEGPYSDALRRTLRGLAYENLGDPRRASIEYAGVTGRHGPGANPVQVRRGREAALRVVRKSYDVASSDRRRGIWADHLPGEWRILRTPGFRIHHRNIEAAARVGAALKFHSSRISNLMALDPDEVPWTRPCDVYLHADATAFRKATGRPERVPAISVIHKRGADLEGHEIHAYQTDPMLLSSSLAHELAHLMIGAVTDYRPFPAVLNEGLALHVEPQCRHRQFAGLFGKIRQPKSIDRLLKVDEIHPPETEFYAQAYRLMAVLLDYGAMDSALRAGKLQVGRDKLARLFGLPSGEALETTYRGRETSRE